MQLFLQVEVGAEGQRIGLVRRGGGEIHHAVEGTAAADPVVQAGADLLAGGRGVAGAAKKLKDKIFRKKK